MAAKTRILAGTITAAKGKARVFVLRDFEAADSAFKRVVGIMFRATLLRPVLFTFEREARFANSIHSFFCFVAFDAVFLDSKKRVVDVRKSVKPFSMLIVPKRDSKYLIECPSGFAEKNRLREGTVIIFES